MNLYKSPLQVAMELLKANPTHTIKRRGVRTWHMGGRWPRQTGKRPEPWRTRLKKFHRDWLEGVYTNSFIHKLCVSLFLVTFNFFTARGPQKYKNIIWFTVHVPSTRNRQMSLKSNRNMTLVVFDNFLMLWRSVSAFGGPGVK